jgi:hypothetical protein
MRISKDKDNAYSSSINKLGQKRMPSSRSYTAAYTKTMRLDLNMSSFVQT